MHILKSIVKITYVGLTLGGLAMGVIWARSYRHYDSAFIQKRYGVWLKSRRGAIQMDWLTGIYLDDQQYAEQDFEALATYLNHTTQPATRIASQQGSAGEILSRPLSDHWRVDFDSTSPDVSVLGEPQFDSNFLGFGAHDEITDPFGYNWYSGWRIRGIIIPDWFTVPALLMLPGAKLMGRFKKRRRHRAQKCVECGYDLRATLNRCPECGTIRS